MEVLRQIRGWNWRVLGAINHVRQVEVFAADLRILGGLKDFWQVGGFTADWRIPERSEDFGQIEGSPADWKRISGRLEEHFRQI